MVTLYDCATGAALERWPVDAAELLATGAYTTDLPTVAPAAPSVPESPVVEPSAPATPSPRRRRSP
jgi:hypothetical protein